MVEDTERQEPMETSAEAERGRADSSDDDDAGAIYEEQRIAAMPEDKSSGALAVVLAVVLRGKKR